MVKAVNKKQHIADKKKLYIWISIVSICLLVGIIILIIVLTLPKPTNLSKYDGVYAKNIDRQTKDDWTDIDKIEENISDEFGLNFNYLKVEDYSLPSDNANSDYSGFISLSSINTKKYTNTCTIKITNGINYDTIESYLTAQNNDGKTDWIGNFLTSSTIDTTIIRDRIRNLLPNNFVDFDNNHLLINNIDEADKDFSLSSVDYYYYFSNPVTYTYSLASIIPLTDIFGSDPTIVDKVILNNQNQNYYKQLITTGCGYDVDTNYIGFDISNPTFQNDLYYIKIIPTVGGIYSGSVEIGIKDNIQLSCKIDRINEYEGNNSFLSSQIASTNDFNLSIKNSYNSVQPTNIKLTSAQIQTSGKFNPDNTTFDMTTDGAFLSIKNPFTNNELTIENDGNINSSFLGKSLLFNVDVDAEKDSTNNTFLWKNLSQTLTFNTFLADDTSDLWTSVPQDDQNNWTGNVGNVWSQPVTDTNQTKGITITGHQWDNDGVDGRANEVDLHNIYNPSNTVSLKRGFTTGYKSADLTIKLTNDKFFCVKKISVYLPNSFDMRYRCCINTDSTSTIEIILSGDRFYTLEYNFDNIYCKSIFYGQYYYGGSSMRTFYLRNILINQ